MHKSLLKLKVTKVNIFGFKIKGKKPNAHQPHRKHLMVRCDRVLFQIKHLQSRKGNSIDSSLLTEGFMSSFCLKNNYKIPKNDISAELDFMS